MKVQVLYFADFKDITGKDKEYFELYNNGLPELINLLLEKYEPFKSLIWDEKNRSLKSIISLAVNDNLVNKKEQQSIYLSEGDKVVFLLPVSGG
ncbi:MAG: MoaD/ThiS family protein [Promethearchaeota archaeon]